MKVHFLQRDSDFDLGSPLPVNTEALKQDLELATLFDAMAAGDKYLRELVEKIVLSSLVDLDAIRYRQAILGDCLKHPEILRELYALAVEGVESKRKARFFWFHDSPDSLLHKSLGMLDLLVEVLKRLRILADERGSAFSSDGFVRFFEMLERELDDDYLSIVDHHLRELRFRHGALISAELGRSNRGTRYVLRTPNDRTLLERLTPGGPARYSFTIPPRDEHGFEALAELRGRGINLVGNAAAQSADHILGFFNVLRAELGFYVGCLNLHERLVEKDQTTCFPAPLSAEDGPALTASELYDPSLAFHLGDRVVGNDVDAAGKQLVLVTGANQGGKSTFLRSVGLAQLMMQAGMFVAAESFAANVCAGVYTHFKREEDASMTRGKFDEELNRMSELADTIEPTALLLCNESFASTNEREGSEIARQVIHALLDARIKVIFVTHMFDLAGGLFAEQLNSRLFLRAEREPDGRRTFRLVEGEPLPTSYGADSYNRIFGVQTA